MKELAKRGLIPSVMAGTGVIREDNKPSSVELVRAVRGG
jgi:hypothetical protein